MPRTKSEDSCPKGKLLDGGMRGKDKQRTGYREVGQYHTDLYFLVCPHVDLGKCFLGEVESNHNKWIYELIHPSQNIYFVFNNN
jgi:hypothetical protein